MKVLFGSAWYITTTCLTWQVICTCPKDWLGGYWKLPKTPLPTNGDKENLQSIHDRIVSWCQWGRERERAALRLPLHPIVSKIHITCLAHWTILPVSLKSVMFFARRIIYSNTKKWILMDTSKNIPRAINNIWNIYHCLKWNANGKKHQSTIITVESPKRWVPSTRWTNARRPCQMISWRRRKLGGRCRSLLGRPFRFWPGGLMANCWFLVDLIWCQRKACEEWIDLHRGLKKNSKDVYDDILIHTNYSILVARLLCYSSGILMIQFVCRPGLWCLNSSPSANLQFWSHQCPETWSSSWTRSPKWSKDSCGSLVNLTSPQQAFLWGWFQCPQTIEYRLQMPFTGISFGKLMNKHCAIIPC